MKRKRNIIKRNSGFVFCCFVAAGASFFTADLLMTQHFTLKSEPVEIIQDSTEAVLAPEESENRTYETDAFTVTASGSVFRGVESERTVEETDSAETEEISDAVSETVSEADSEDDISEESTGGGISSGSGNTNQDSSRPGSSTNTGSGSSSTNSTGNGNANQGSSRPGSGSAGSGSGSTNAGSGSAGSGSSSTNAGSGSTSSGNSGSGSSNTGSGGGQDIIIVDPGNGDYTYGDGSSSSGGSSSGSSSSGSSSSGGSSSGSSSSGSSSSGSSSSGGSSSGGSSSGGSSSGSSSSGGSSSGSGSSGSSSSSSSSAWTPDDVVLWGISSRYISESELYNYSSSQLRLIRNEILALNGRIFQSQDLIDYFSQKSWYTPTYSPEEFDANMFYYLNDYEEANLQVILDYEDALAGY